MAQSLLDGFANSPRACERCKNPLTEQYSYLVSNRLYHLECLTPEDSAQRFEVETNSFVAGVELERSVWIAKLNTVFPDGDRGLWSDELNRIDTYVTFAALTV
jgi:hypothetical protein